MVNISQVLADVHYLALICVEAHAPNICPLTHLVQRLLQFFPVFIIFYNFPALCVICKLDNVRSRFLQCEEAVAVVGQSSAGVSGDAYAILIIFICMVPVINYNLLGEITYTGQYSTGSNFHKLAKKIP